MPSIFYASLIVFVYFFGAVVNGKSQADDGASSPGDAQRCTMGLSCGGDDGVRMDLPIKGPRGLVGPPGPKGMIGYSGEPGLEGAPYTSDCKVAFLVGLTEIYNYPAAEENSQLRVDRVVTNVGEGYHFQIDQFIAPCAGTYQFFVTVTAQENKKAAAVISSSSKGYIGTVKADSSKSFGSASNSYILEMNAGDVIKLEADRELHSYFYGYLSTSFSGMRLW